MHEMELEQEVLEQERFRRQRMDQLLEQLAGIVVEAEVGHMADWVDSKRPMLPFQDLAEVLLQKDLRKMSSAVAEEVEHHHKD
jgi:hypothetical protein